MLHASRRLAPGWALLYSKIKVLNSIVPKDQEMKKKKPHYIDVRGDFLGPQHRTTTVVVSWLTSNGNAPDQFQ